MGKKIFVIDDEPDTIELVQVILKKNGFLPVVFNDSRRALNELKSGQKPDLILLDMRMPEINGPEFCKILQADPKLKNLKVVFFTASIDSDPKILKECGVQAYIFKPFDIHGFIKQISQLSQ